MTPQYIDEVGNKYFYKNIEMKILQREDGPAVEWWDGRKSWYLNGEKLTEQEFLKRTAKEVVLTMNEIADKFGVDVSKLKISK